MRILLIGYEGYVGSGLFRYLSNKNEVVGWGRKDNILNLKAHTLKDLQISAVINCGVIMDRVSTNFVAESPSDRVNVIGMRTLISALKGSEIKLIHISTKDVFGNVYFKSDVEEDVDEFTPHFLIDDSQPFSPETIYGKTKLMAEYIAESHPLTTVIRLSSCYTDFDHDRAHWIPNIINSLLLKNPVTVTNKGKQVRDILHVNDLGRLIINIIESEEIGEKINVGGGPDNVFSLLQIIKMVDPNAKIIESEGDDYGFAFNNRLVTELFKWNPKILFKENLSVLKGNLIKREKAIS